MTPCRRPTISWTASIPAQGRPTKGVPLNSGCLPRPERCGLDTAAYSILALSPNQIPLWSEALKRFMPGSDPADIEYPLEGTDLFDATGFEMSPERDLEFDPVRIVKGRVRSLLKHFTKS